MAAVLRKVKSAISAAIVEAHPGNAETTETGEVDVRLSLQEEQHRFYRPTDAALSSGHLHAHCRDHGTRPLTDFRKHLVRKASTFTLRSTHRRAVQEKGDQEEVWTAPTPKAPILASYRLHNQRSRRPRQATDLQAGTNAAAARSTPAYVDRSSNVTAADPSAIATSGPAIRAHRVARGLQTSSRPSDTADSAQGVIRHNKRSVTRHGRAGGTVPVNMASDHPAAPPVPYTRLKEITEHACENALSNVQAYSHPDTESWNTAIINSILGALVAETNQKPTAGTSGHQPQFKYVVNSTIIQHAATSTATTASDDKGKKIGGRRGMHAASGAYWNNEKDGMWSYKYPGADSKGLDVVVGIIWVWVG